MTIRWSSATDRNLGTAMLHSAKLEGMIAGRDSWIVALPVDQSEMQKGKAFSNAKLNPLPNPIDICVCYFLSDERQYCDSYKRARQL